MSEHTHYYRHNDKYYTYKEATCSVCGVLGADEGKYNMLSCADGLIEYDIKKHGGSTPPGIRSVQWKDDFYYLAQMCSACMGDIYIEKKGFEV